ncbi:MAG: hypothetical protein JNM18_04670 [Planctomycetaceae bacterium]|nr:hypothetical protein [Planctomycetaceae bacterium]
MSRDIDYAAIAVRNAILAKFAETEVLDDLSVSASEKTIIVRHGLQQAEGTRDQLLSALRGAQTYAQLWDTCSSSTRR